MSTHLNILAIEAMLFHIERKTLRPHNPSIQIRFKLYSVKGVQVFALSVRDQALSKYAVDVSRTDIIFVAVWQALGARPTPMAFGEVFTSLQNGTIDGQENPLALIRSANFNEVQRFVNRTEHVWSWIYVVISERRWQGLSAADRDIVAEATRRAQAFERTLFMEDERNLEVDLRGKGMTFVDSDKAAFAAKAQPAALAATRDEARPLLEQILATRA